MKRFVMSISIISISVMLAVIAFAKMPSPDPDALWQYITKESPYTKWFFWPDHEGMQPGRAPHGPFHKVYINDLALNSAQPPVQYGSIQVKESYGMDKKLKAITVMYKVKGYNPDAGDWFWVKYSPDGKADAFGKLKGCVGCHGARAANDFIFVHEFM
ncbi:MAG: cytochrome P460 family protein [Pseudomonadota bacterium]